METFSGLRLTQRKKGLQIVILLVAALASVALEGFDYGVGNNVYHIPITLDYAHSAEGPSDIFHQSLARFVSGFWPALSLFVTETNIFGVFFALHIIVRFFTVFMIWKIAGLFSNNSLISALFACFYFFFYVNYHRSPVGGSELLVNYLTHSQVVIPFVLCSWFFLIKRQFFVSSAILGLTFNINAFAAIWGAAAVGIATLIILKNEGTKKIITATGMMIGIFLLVATPTIVWILKTLTADVRYEPFSFGQFLREEYFPFHTFIDVQWEDTALMVLVIVTTFLTLKHTSLNWPEDKRALLFSTLSAYSVIFAFGMILPYVTDSRLLLNLYPLRMDSYIIFLLGITILSWCIGSFHSVDLSERARSVIVLFSLLNGNMILLLVSVILGNDLSSKSTFNKYAPLMLLVAMGTVHAVFGTAPVLVAGLWGKTAAFIFILQSGIIVYFLPRTGDYLKLAFPLITAALIGVFPEIHDLKFLALIFLIYLALAFYVAQKSYKPIISTAIIVSLLIILSTKIIWLVITSAVFLLPILAMRLVPFIKKYLSLVGPPDTVVLALLLVCFLIGGAVQMGVRGGLSPNPEADRALKDTQLWARNNTPPHTVFLPIGVSGFSTLSRRPVWIDIQNGAMVMWAPETYKLWSTRWRQLKPVDTVAEAQNLARKEGIKFIVFSKDKVSSDRVARSCIAYENRKYWIAQPC